MPKKPANVVVRLVRRYGVGPTYTAIAVALLLVACGWGLLGGEVGIALFVFYGAGAVALAVTVWAMSDHWDDKTFHDDYYE